MDSQSLPESFDAAFDWLARRTNYETMATQRYDARTYGLARVERLLDELGRPDHHAPSIQVVGSKGKGSTSACLDAILRHTGRRTGLYTSPHLVDPRERIRVDGIPVADELFVRAIRSLVPVAERARSEGVPATFFELHLAAALACFRDAGCDAVVLEAGMGGRLDATTAARRNLLVLTNVSVDHGRQLGRTRAAIAAEKVAAARSGLPVVCGEPGSTSAGRVVREHCEAVGAPLLQRGRDFRVGGVRATFDTASGRAATHFVLRRPARDGSRTVATVPLLGAHQAENASLALLAAIHERCPGGPVPRTMAVEGLLGAHVAARGQVVDREPWVIVDGAHSPRSLGVLARSLSETVPHRRAVYVLGMAADKDVGRSLRALVGHADEVIATTSGQPRASDPEDLAERARAVGLSASSAPDLTEALARARSITGREDLVVVTGSLYLCGAYPDLSV